MASAYKCDRCGALYENKPENTTGMVVTKNNFVKDICKNCLDELVRFWFEPINAQKKEKEKKNV